MSRQLTKRLIILTAIFSASSASAGMLLSPDEMHGYSGKNTDNTGGVILIILVVLFFLYQIIRFIFKNIEANEIEKENIQNFKKIKEKLSDTAKYQGLMNKIRNYHEIFIKADESYCFGNLYAAEEKVKEINNKSESIAFINKSQSRDGCGYTYTVFEFKK